MVRLSGIAATVFCALLFWGCQSSDDAAERRAEKAREHFDALSKRGINTSKEYTLPECINDALQHNLDLKVEELQKAIAEEHKTAALLGMLPSLTYQYDIKSRSNQPGSTSIDLKTDEVSLQTSRSSKKVESTHNFNLALSVLDFGLAYFNSVQAQDGIILAETQTRRVAQNLSYEVAKAYFEVASIQNAIYATEELLEKCKGIQTIFKNLEDSRALSKQRILQERRRFVNLEKSLMFYRRNYETSCIRLRSLMGYLPLQSIRVDTSLLTFMNVHSVPDVELLEELALKKRPELSQLDIQAHINTVEVRKSIVKMMPNVNLFTDWIHSSNPFLYHQSWWEMGIRASYDLLKLPSKIMSASANIRQGEVIEMRTKALSIAVMAQVRIAYANLIENKEIYEFREKTSSVYRQHLDMAKKAFQSGGGAMARFELDRLELETAERDILRTQALADCYLAYYRLLNTVGVSSFEGVEAQKNATQTAALSTD